MQSLTSPETGGEYTMFRFFSDGRAVENAPECGMSLRAAGSMRFRWEEQNPTRDCFLAGIAAGRQVVPVQLNHTKTVFAVSDASGTFGKIGDGIITRNRALLPVITVADCMPIFLFEPESGVFGIVHSGWKGTGIAAQAIFLAEERYGARADGFLVILGPHIRNCCYIVNEERAQLFSQNFTVECVTEFSPEDADGLPFRWNTGGGKQFRLSLEKANHALLLRAGVQEKNITSYTDCTCCNERFGSNRRETACGTGFTVQAGFIGWRE